MSRKIRKIWSGPLPKRKHQLNFLLGACVYIYIYFVIHNIVLCLVNLVPTVSKKNLVPETEISLLWNFAYLSHASNKQIQVRVSSFQTSKSDSLGALLGCEYFQTKPTALKESFFGCAVGTLWVFQASVLILTFFRGLAVYFWLPKKAGPFIHGKCRVCLQLSCWVGFLGKHLQCGTKDLTCFTQNHHPHLNKSTKSTSHLAFGMLHKNISKSNDS